MSEARIRAVLIKHLKSNVYVTLNTIGSFRCNLCSHWLIQILKWHKLGEWSMDQGSGITGQLINNKVWRYWLWVSLTQFNFLHLIFNKLALVILTHARRACWCWRVYQFLLQNTVCFLCFIGYRSTRDHIWTMPFTNLMISLALQE